MVSRFAAITNKEIPQIIKQAVREMYEEGLEALTGKALSVWLEFIDETGEKVFSLQMQIKVLLRSNPRLPLFFR